MDDFVVKCKYIFVSGGSCTADAERAPIIASVARLLKARALKTELLRLDPACNVNLTLMDGRDCGEHYVCADGGAAPFVFGTYERLGGLTTSSAQCVTFGSLLSDLLEVEKRTDRDIPLVGFEDTMSEFIAGSMIAASGKSQADAMLIDIGGCPEDLSSRLVQRAIQRLRYEMGDHNSTAIHIITLPEGSDAARLGAVRLAWQSLQAQGIRIDMLVCRSKTPLSAQLKERIAILCDLPTEAIIYVAKDATLTLPTALNNQRMDNLLCRQLELDTREPRLSEWLELLEAIDNARDKITVALVGRRLHHSALYISVQEALRHAALANGCRLELLQVDAGDLLGDEGVDLLADADCILIAGEEQLDPDSEIAAANYARLHAVPLLALGAGTAAVVIEYARNVLGMKGAAVRGEDSGHCVYPVMQVTEEFHAGRHLSLGCQNIAITPGSRAAAAYGKPDARERFRYLYRMNNDFRESFSEAGLRVTGTTHSRDIAAIIELPSHPWYVALQFHPEFNSQPQQPHRLLCAFIAAALKRRDLD
ncbi:MAG: CTP synthase [Firmicutes bacterium]|nr:CTP synthase [Bacillota bacterium]